MSVLLQNKLDRMERALAESRIGLEVAADAPIEDFVAKTKFNNILNVYCQEEEPRIAGEHKFLFNEVRDIRIRYVRH